ncbi:ABC-type nitrate/sulfonate/bicarbonate transport system permease component [Saccharothrix tamanrassetensis]|uniref:ABC-type nitrate/sulfonate/bicarbonate transport system permease component n=1 Tax=Saccharothrix tamanrassetensis TaxID=1051531 RepID=A0A841CUK4_9PSEU|nr:ABC transporter permease subunit [Saccharothrix tamanrassetensis]MBB5959828.1 ABC-type nitrate/sulfonate/bicarbonate transport system permease component [Saccharothrix tamanrassetensis]
MNGPPPLGRLRRAVAPGLTVLALLLIWQAASSFGDLGAVVPSPLDVLRQMGSDAHYYPQNAAATMSSAGQGYLWGNGIAIVLALGTLPFPRVQALLERLAVGAIALPLIAIAPLLAIAFPGDTPSVILAAQAVVFTTLVATVLGLNSVDKTSVEVIRACGGSEWTVIRKVRLPAAIPSCVAGLQVAAPSAILGAIIGEYMGGTRGLGVAMVQAQGAFDVPRAWGLAIVTSLLAAVAFLVLPAATRLAFPWTRSTDTVLGARAERRRPRGGGGLAGLRRAVLAVVSTVVGVVLGWWLLVLVVPGGDAVARGPVQVLSYFADGDTQLVTSDGETQDALSYLLSSLGRTLVDAGVGFAAGLVLAVLTAVLAHEFAVVERILMPISIALRSVPIVAAMPLLALVFGRGVVAVTVLIAVMTFFPVLVNLLLAMKAVPRSATDLFSAVGAGRRQRITKLLMPYSLQALLASVKVALPLSVGAAMVAEWLATGHGLGASMTVAATLSDYNFVWGGVAAVLLASLAAYHIANALEDSALRRLE